MNDECLICGAPLEYLSDELSMTCAVCGRKESSKTRCTANHYVCSECHMGGMDRVFALCLEERSADPVQILRKMMALDTCHMHGPEHHVMVAAALLTAYRNAGGDIELESAIRQAYSRGREVPGGVCGFWGACGAGISTGIYMSIITKATPLAGEAWGLSNQMTARALESIGMHGGPRCCKRDSYLAVLQAIDFTAEKLGVRMEKSGIVCTHSALNNQCLQEKCLFHQREGNTMDKTKVAFICVHNSCRSQMAEALGKKYLADLCDCYSAGTQTKPQINQDAVRLMKKVYGIDMEKTQYSKLFADIPEADIVISMGCNVVCPYVPGKMNLNWGLDDPTGQGDEAFLATMKKIEERVLELRKTVLAMQEKNA